MDEQPSDTLFSGLLGTTVILEIRGSRKTSRAYRWTPPVGIREPTGDLCVSLEAIWP